MAIGKASDFTIYQDQFHGGITETLAQETNAFNSASNGTIILNAVERLGDYAQDTFMKTLSGLVSRRDTTSVAAATDLALTQDENISVKLNRKIGPVAQTLDAFRKINKDPSIMSFILGQQAAKAIMAEYLNTGIGAAVAAIGQDNEQDNDTATITTAGLVQAQAVLGDRGDSVAAYVMHSKAYYDLVQSQIAANIFEVSGYNVREGAPVTLGKPVIVTDSSSLISVGTGPGAVDEYYTLGLVRGAITVEESEGREVNAQIITGLENLVIRWQSEFAFNLGLKGYKWDIANGAANPTSGALTTATNWDKTATSDKDLLGVRLVTQ